MSDAAIDALKTYEWGVNPKALKPLQEATISSHGDTAARKELETKVVAALGTDIPRAAKDYLCRILRTIGTAASVPTLAPLLTDKELSHMGRYALERIPAPEAGKALRDALPKTSGDHKIGVIASLGVRGEADSVAPLGALLADPDAAVAGSAAYSLGVIGSKEAAKALLTAKARTETKDAFANASLIAAESLLAAGNKGDAKTTYEYVLKSKPSELIKDAAERGIKASA